MSLTITSSDFAHMGEIPLVHTCDGQDTSPKLSWSGVPNGVSSLAMIVDDPDAPDPAAPKTTWIHWVLYNMAPDSCGLTSAAQLPPGTREGLNDWKRIGYAGPCPPVGTHRYFFKLYALDITLPDLGTPTKADLEKAMIGHVVAQTELIGLYRRG